MKLFLGLSVLIITAVVSAQVQVHRISSQEEAELNRVNVYRSPNHHPENDRVVYHDDKSDNYAPPSRRPSHEDNEESNVPVSLKLKPKPKFANYKSVTFFAWELFQFCNKESVANYVLSPLSPQLLLSHLVTVADGITKNEITNAIRYNNPNQLGNLVSSMLQSSSGRELNIASAFFVNKDMKLNQEFLEDTVSRNVDVVYVKFARQDEASRTVNTWVSEKTKHKIENLQLAINSDTRMLMTSVVYFAAKWLYSFHPAKNELFYGSTAKPVKMMSIKKKFNYGNIDRLAEWVSVPYDSAESMVIIMPKEGLTLDNMIKSMTEGVFLNITENIYSEETQANVDLTMPTFSISSIVSLVEPFRNMGMSSLFSPEANFPKLAKNERVQLSNAQQQSILEVNEVGTIAASLTSFSVVALSFSAPVPNVKLTINRPFLCMIVDRDTNIPLFVAKVSNPQ